MGDYPAFPDAEAVVAGWLRHDGRRVYSSIPKDPTYPLVTIRRAGGTPAVPQYLDAARIDVSTWGNNQGEAHDLAADCRADLMDLAGETVHDPFDAFISGVVDAVGLAYIQDPDTNRDRYVFGVVVFLRAAAPEDSS